MDASERIDRATDQSIAYIFDLWDTGEVVGSAKKLRRSIKIYSSYYASYFWGVVDAYCRENEIEDSDACDVWVAVYESIMLKLHGVRGFDPKMHSVSMVEASLGQLTALGKICACKKISSGETAPSGLWGVKGMVDELVASSDAHVYGRSRNVVFLGKVAYTLGGAFFLAIFLIQCAAVFSLLDVYFGLGPVLAILIFVICLWLRMVGPLLLGAFFGALLAWEWPWYWALVFAFPGIAFAVKTVKSSGFGSLIRWGGRSGSI